MSSMAATLASGSDTTSLFAKLLSSSSPGSSTSKSSEQVVGTACSAEHLALSVLVMRETVLAAIQAILHGSECVSIFICDKSSNACMREGIPSSWQSSRSEVEYRRPRTSSGATWCDMIEGNGGQPARNFRLADDRNCTCSGMFCHFSRFIISVISRTCKARTSLAQRLPQTTLVTGQANTYLLNDTCTRWKI